MLSSLLRFLSWRGRISRSRFFLSMSTLLLTFTILYVFFNTAISHFSTWLLYPPLFISAFALTVKRLHDASSSAGWLFLLLIPVMGPFILLIMLCRRGTVGENPYGNDPKETGTDYLTVRIGMPGK